MVQLNPDCLIIRIGDNYTPIFTNKIVVDHLGEGELPQEIIDEATTGVVAYFQNVMKRNVITEEEFAVGLKQVLERLGYTVNVCRMTILPPSKRKYRRRRWEMP